MPEEHNEPEFREEPVTPAPAAAPVQPLSPRNTLGIPIAIVIAAVLIGGAIIYTGNMRSGTTQVSNNDQNTAETAEAEIEPVTDADHILGNPNAPVVIVEYSDYECPFCKNFHATMQQIMSEYGTQGKVAWVYRNFPLEQLHPNAPMIAAAAECVAKLGGNDAFWKFTDSIFSGRGTNEFTNPAKLPDYAAQAGVSKDQYQACVEANTFTDKITEDVQKAIKAGARGTPYSIMMVGDQRGVINGAQPYTTVKQMIDTVLTQIETAG